MLNPCWTWFSTFNMCAESQHTCCHKCQCQCHISCEMWHWNFTGYMDPVSLLLGQLCRDNIIDASLNKLYHILAYVARKKMFMSRINYENPTKTSWHRVLILFNYLWGLYSTTGHICHYWFALCFKPHLSIQGVPRLLPAGIASSTFPQSQHFNVLLETSQLLYT